MEEETLLHCQARENLNWYAFYSITYLYILTWMGIRVIEVGRERKEKFLKWCLLIARRQCEGKQLEGTDGEDAAL